MGDVISKIPTQFNTDGTVKLTANLLTQYHRITLENVQRAAIAQYNVALAVADTIPPSWLSIKTINPGNNSDYKRQFYKKVHSSVVAHLINSILLVTGYEDLLLQQDKFSFYNNAIGDMEFDGANMIYLIFMKTDPSTVVGFDYVLKNLDTTNIGDHPNCVNTMLTIMEGHYKNLHENRRPPEHFRRLVLETLSTGPNYLFNNVVRRIADDIEYGIGSNVNITPD